MIKKRGIYLIQEKGCLNPKTGAFQHISMGLNQLSVSFDIKLYLSNEKIELNKSLFQNTIRDIEITKSTSIKNIFYGTIKDLYLLFSNLKDVYSLVQLFKNEKINFVYERTSYLNFSGLIASKIVGISHFYEANGFQYKGRQRYYKSIFIFFAKFFEKKAYSISNHTFFVGSYGDFWKIKKDNWSNVENGIEKNFVIDFVERQKNKIDICFVGRLMDHQKIEILIDALKIFENKDKIKVNLVGSGLELIESEIKGLGVSVVNHGFVERSKIINLLSTFDIAIISGSNMYQSCMKLFDYGAGGCAVIAPEIHNLKLWFLDELVFFNGTPEDLSNKLEFLVKNENKEIQIYGKKLQNKVKNNFTWEIIFKNKTKIIIKNLC